MNRYARTAALFALVGFSGPALAQSLHGTLYKDPNCACCEGHAAYLREHGIELDIKPVDDLAQLSEKAGIPAEYQGCHAIFLNGYVIEGHVSNTVIEKLLAERPADIVGISLPGMPLGVPGMGGEKDGPNDIYAIKKDGTASVYAVE